MLWFVFALLSALISAAQNLITRHAMIKADAYAFAFLENVLTLLFFVPFALLEWALPREPEAWLLVVIGGILWSVISVMYLMSYQRTTASLRAPVSESRLLWVLLFSALILGEAVTGVKIFGVIIIMAGIVTLTYKRGSPLGSFNDRGVRVTLIVSLLIGLVSIVDKKALAYFPPNVYALFVYLIPSIAVGIIVARSKRHHLDTAMRSQKLLVLGIVAGGALSYLFQLQAFKLTDLSLVYPVLRLSTIFTVLGGIIFLHEREEVWRKLIATVVVVSGVLIVTLGLPF